MKDIIEHRLNTAGRIGQGFSLLKIPADVFRGHFGTAAEVAAAMALIEMVRKAMTSDKALEYFSKEKP